MPGESDSSGIFHSMRYALGIEYRGTRYHGWQRQTGHPEPSVQAQLEEALSSIADSPITVICAGRTDSGVHASGQVVHFDTQVQRPLRAWLNGVNTRLPDDIKVLWVQVVPQEFHARFSAQARTYRYFIVNRTIRPALGSELLTWEKRPLDESCMHDAAQQLLGEQDFSAFRGASCQSRTPFRCVESVSVSRYGALVMVEIRANAFLHNMVRNIVGTLLEVGCGNKPPRWIAEVLASRDRRCAGKTAAPSGLYLYRVDYPPSFNLPITASENPDLNGGMFEAVISGI